MTGSQPRTIQRSLNGTDYSVQILQHEHGLSIVVEVPGLAPEEENERTFSSEHEALAAAEDIAGLLISKRDAE